MKNESTDNESRNSSNPHETQKFIDKDSRNSALSKSPMREPTKQQMSRKAFPDCSIYDLSN